MTAPPQLANKSLGLPLRRRKLHPLPHGAQPNINMAGKYVRRLTWLLSQMWAQAMSWQPR
jgi:hypothetical protein